MDQFWKQALWTLASVLCLTLEVQTNDIGQTNIAGSKVLQSGLSKERHGDLPLPNVTHSGYLDVDQEAGTEIFFIFYEALEGTAGDDTPIILWLQGGPGCSSMIGNFYSLGPYWINKSLGLEENPGTWNRKYALLFIDNPVGSGFSLVGKGKIPEDEMEIATDLYAAMQSFFKKFDEYRPRPLFIMGESYAGKYVPSIGHFILQQMEHQNEVETHVQLKYHREIPERGRRLGPPTFKLHGLGIGNGLTDPQSQCLRHADTAYYMGVLDASQRLEALQRQLEVLSLVYLGAWQTAWERRSDLLEFIRSAGGLGTMLNYRRLGDYDDNNLVERYLNDKGVQDALGAANISFITCSEDVDRVLGPDVMKSVAYLVPDILAHMSLLLYQGQDDPQDGPAINEPWIRHIDWGGNKGFTQTKRELWRLGGREPKEGLPGGRRAKPDPKGDVVGYWREYSTLTHVVIRNAGHMVPHDQPEVSQAMVERWVDDVLHPPDASRVLAA